MRVRLNSWLGRANGLQARWPAQALAQPSAVRKIIVSSCRLSASAKGSSWELALTRAAEDGPHRYPLRDMALDVGWHALRKAYAGHRDARAGLPAGQSAHLLLFYSVECGLKAAMIHRRGIRGANQLESRERGHDVRQLAKALRLSRQLLVDLRDCRKRSDGSAVAVHELHEAWRYGTSLETAGENQVVGGLEALNNWCRDELSV